MPAQCRNRHSVGESVWSRSDGAASGQKVDLVQRAHDRLVDGADLLQRVVHSLGLSQDLRMRDVHHVHQQVSVGHLLQSGAEGCYELSGQLLDEPNGVGEKS